MVYKIGWFSTGRDKAARDLLKISYREIHQNKDSDAKIVFVFSNRDFHEDKESDKFFKLVQQLNLKLINFSSEKFYPDKRKIGLEKEKSEQYKIITEWRRQYDREVERLISPFQPDLIVLAGYMLIVGDELCKKYPMINLHPAKPSGPKGTWQEVIWQLIEKKEAETGVMMHLVTPDLDRGPAVAYCTFPIKGRQFYLLWQSIKKYKSTEELMRKEGGANRLFKLIRSEGVKRELPLIIYTIKEFIEGNIKIEKGKVKNNKGKILKQGYCLNEKLALIDQRPK